MKKLNKKGFTIVELVIVIALIAILAAVLIPTFSNVVNNAHESNDIVMVKNLNTVLNAEEINGNKATTMQDAVDQAREGGYNVDKLTPTSTGDIVWDQASNRFVLLNAKGSVVYRDETVTEVDLANGAYKLWKITKNVAAETKGYSLYLDDDYTGSDLAELVVTTGIDVGNHTDVGAISYTGTAVSRRIIFRTNGGTLTVNGENDTVYHYGAADLTDIKAVDVASYHECGVAAYVRIAAGHYVAESTAKIINLNVAASTVTISEKEGAKVVAYSKGAEDVIVTVNGATKEVSTVKTESEIKNDAANSAVVADGGVAEINGIQFKDLQSAFNAATDGDTVKLISDYKIPDTVADVAEERIVISHKITLDFGSYRVIGQAKMSDYNSNFTTIIVDADTTFIAEDAGGIYTDVSSEGIGPYGVNIRNGAKLTIKGGSYFGGGTAIQVQKGELEILAGKFSCAPYDEPYRYNYLINVIDAAFKDGTAKVFIKGGYFAKFDPSANPEGEGTSYVAEGYVVEPVSGDPEYTYQVKKAD